MKRALILTLPVAMGYIVIGIAFGLLLEKAGYNWVWALGSSVFVLAGSMQFVLVGLLAQQVPLYTVLITTLLVNSRHLFYGLSFIEHFKKMDWRRYYMIFSLTDETYAILTSTEKESELMFKIAILNQTYWIIGSVLGSLMGSFIPFNTAGVEFAMSALFIVIVVEQWFDEKNRVSSIIGFICAILALLIFGSEHFLLAALGATLVALLLRIVK
ncbi:MAG: AzlC family ABC transporter permease [Sphaerochaetaceae bacterium]|jgi:4-azaleucine resistance transporter AzlC